MQEEYKNQQHITYKEYQKKFTQKSNDGIVIFVSAFFILLLFFLGIAKLISPDIDVSIGTQNVVAEEEQQQKSEIDERLKLLQQEDSEKDMFATELDEKVVIPKTAQNSSIPETTQNIADQVKDDKEEIILNKPEEKQVVNEPVKSSKVVVGYYGTKEQAEVAKGIIAESGMNITPFVRSIGGAYTIQVGSYSTREKAETVVNDLLRNNYPARIIVE